MSKRKWEDIRFLGFMFLALWTPLFIAMWMGIGKFQLCKYYFSEMQPVACFFTQLPAVMPRSK